MSPRSPALVENAPRDGHNSRCENTYTPCCRQTHVLCKQYMHETNRRNSLVAYHSRFRDFDHSERIFARQVLDFYLSDNAPTPCYCYRARGRRGPSVRVLLKRLCVSATATMRIRRARHPLASGVALRSRSLVFGSKPSGGRAV